MFKFLEGLIIGAVLTHMGWLEVFQIVYQTVQKIVEIIKY